MSISKHVFQEELLLMLYLVNMLTVSYPHISSYIRRILPSPLVF